MRQNVEPVVFQGFEDGVRNRIDWFTVRNDVLRKLLPLQISFTLIVWVSWVTVLCRPVILGVIEVRLNKAGAHDVHVDIDARPL